MEQLPGIGPLQIWLVNTLRKMVVTPWLLVVKSPITLKVYSCYRLEVLKGVVSLASKFTLKDDPEEDLFLTDERGIYSKHPGDICNQ